MIDALKFVQGAMRVNNVAPELEHYQIKDGRVVGYNGMMALSAPLDLSIDVKPKATLFYKALQACGDTVSIKMTTNGRLQVRSGAFSAYVPCIEKEVYEAQPEGTMYPAPEGLVGAFKRLLPFISQDASRPWAMGLSVGGQCYTATNNIIILQIWEGHGLPVFNCPRFAVAEVARIGEAPTHIQVSDSSVTFHYEDGRWLRTQVLTAEWPQEMVEKLLSGPCDAKPVEDGLFEGLDKILPFIPASTTAVRMEGGALATGDGEAGATIEVEGLPDGPVFSAKVLALLAEEMDSVDWTLYPAPCPFRGQSSRGIILGQRT